LLIEIGGSCWIADREEYMNKARFLYGDSMGGAVALDIHRKEPQDWNGAILVAPMCKVHFLVNLHITPKVWHKVDAFQLQQK